MHVKNQFVDDLQNQDYAKDCEACESSSNKIDILERVIEIDANQTDEQKEITNGDSR